MRMAEDFSLGEGRATAILWKISKGRAKVGGRGAFRPYGGPGHSEFMSKSGRESRDWAIVGAATISFVHGLRVGELASVRVRDLHDHGLSFLDTKAPRSRSGEGGQMGRPLGASGCGLGPNVVVTTRGKVYCSPSEAPICKRACGASPLGPTGRTTNGWSCAGERFRNGGLSTSRDPWGWRVSPKEDPVPCEFEEEIELLRWGTPIRCGKG